MGGIAIGFGARLLVMGKQKQRTTSADIRLVSSQRFSEGRKESGQSKTSSNDLHALDEMAEVYRQHSHL